MPSKIVLHDDAEDRQTQVLNNDSDGVSVSREVHVSAAGPPNRSPSNTVDNGRTPLAPRDTKSVRKRFAFTESSRRLTRESRKAYFGKDIRASSRLSGYAFCWITCLVLLVSAVMFQRNGNDEAVLKVLQVGYVDPWKATAAVYFGAVGLGLTSILLICHVDAIMCPALWIALFKDGSTYEMLILRVLIVVWAAGLFLCTSSYSVGKLAPTVR